MWVNHGPFNMAESVLPRTSVIQSCRRWKFSRSDGNIPTIGQFGTSSSLLLQHPNVKKVAWAKRRLHWTMVHKEAMNTAAIGAVPNY